MYFHTKAKVLSKDEANATEEKIKISPLFINILT
jgi:hypothetical protein